MSVRDAPLKLFGAINSDARHWQLLALSGLFLISVFTTDFGARPVHLASAFAGAMTAQLIGTWLAGAKFEWKSAAITSLSLSILMRAVAPWMWVAAGLIGVGLKFAVRYRGKHLFNPACIGIVVMCLVFGRDVWVSPGQWGQAPLIAGWAVALAALVLSSAKRLDIALGFIGAGFRHVYFRKPTVCEPGSYCARPASAWITKTALWASLILVVAALTIDWWAPLLY